MLVARRSGHLREFISILTYLSSYPRRRFLFYLAILLKLLTGRLSQPTRQLRIQSTISRSFTSTEWTLLSKRLGDWKKTLDEVKGVVDEALAMGQRGGQQGGDGERRERRQQGGGGQKREHQQQQQQQQQVPVVAA